MKSEPDELLDYPISETIEGFNYNENGVCLNPELICTKTVGNPTYFLGVAKTRSGWDYDFSYEGGGSSACGAWADDASSDTKLGAIIAGAKRIIECFTNRAKESPGLKKHAKELNSLKFRLSEWESQLNNLSNKNPMPKKKTAPAPVAVVQPETTYELIPLENIQADENQPRKFFDQHAQDELTTSVRSKGILQPILVRPLTGDSFLLVCGERRYRSAKEAGLKVIPAVIRDLSDDEALELQIIENLQRKEVHPMEEAAAFKSLAEKGHDIAEIAARVGKSAYYARQRMKLCDLIDGFQEAYFKHRLSNKDALTIASFPADTQKEILEDQNETGVIEFTSWELERYSGKLTSAPFDLSDADLDKKAGACTVCQFNTAAASLFPENEQSATCTKISCFTHKSALHFTRELEKAKEEPGMIFVNTDYNNHSDKVTDKLVKDGHTYISNKYNFTKIDEPERPDMDDYNEDDYDSREDMMEDFEEDMQRYDDEIPKYKLAVASGKYKKAFCVNGNEKGKYVYVIIHKTPSGAATSSKMVAEKVDAGTVTVADIKEEMDRLNAREKRAKELDAEKVQARIVEMAKAPMKELPVDRTDLTLEYNNLRMMLLLMWDAAQYGVSGHIKTACGLPSNYNSNPEKILEALNEMSESQIYLCLCNVIDHKFSSSMPTGHSGKFGAFVYRFMAQTLTPNGSIDSIEAEQKEKADKRQEKLKKRLAELKAKKAELEKPKKKK